MDSDYVDRLIVRVGAYDGFPMPENLVEGGRRACARPGGRPAPERAP